MAGSLPQIWRKLFENNGQGPNIKSGIIPKALPDGTPGIIGVDNVTTKVDAAGIISTTDAGLRIKAWGYISQTPAVLAGKNITSVTRLETGVFRVYSPLITTTSGVLAFGDNYDGSGGCYLHMSTVNYPLQAGSVVVEARTVDGTLANNGRFTIVIL